MNKLTEDELSLIRARFLARRDMPEHYTGIRKEYMMVDAQADMEKLLDHIDTLQDELEKCIAIITQETDVCLFGGGVMRDGLPRRTSCRFGHPGCKCDDLHVARQEKDDTP